MVPSSLQMTQARFQPTGSLAVTTGTAAKWTLPYTGTFVATIPRDEASSEHVAKHIASTRHSFQAEVYVGPYVIRGTLLCPDANLYILGSYLTFGMQTVEIDGLQLGARLKGLAAPYVIVRTAMLHGIVTAQ